MAKLNALFFTFFSLFFLAQSSDVAAAKGLVQRIAPAYAEKIVFHQEKSKTSPDYYELEFKKGKLHISANNANEAMISPRLGHEPPPKSPSEMVVESVRQHKRLDGLLDRLRLLTELSEGSECCVERMINAEQDRIKVTLALLATGSLGSRPVAAASLRQAADVLGWSAVVEASLVVLYMASCREAGREAGGDGMKVLRRSLFAGVAAKLSIRRETISKGFGQRPGRQVTS